VASPAVLIACHPWAVSLRKLSVPISRFIFCLLLLRCVYSGPLLRYGYEDVSWKKLREYARPAEANIVVKMLQQSSSLAGTAANRVTSIGSSLTSSIMFQSQAVFEKVKSFIPVGAAEAAPEETEEQKAKRLAEEAGADLIRKQKAAAEERAKSVKAEEERAAAEAKKNPAAAAFAASTALNPQPKPKELPSEVQKRPNDPSNRQPCRIYSWLSVWKEFADREVSVDGGDVKIVHVRRPFSTADAALISSEPALPIMSSLLDKEIGWITHEEREQFEDALFSQPIGRCCEGRLKAEREALQNLIRKTQIDLTSKIVWASKNDGGNTQRSTASDASAMAAIAADEEPEADEEEDSGEPEQIAMLPSYKITPWGTIDWTFMDTYSGDVNKLHEKKDPSPLWFVGSPSASVGRPSPPYLFGQPIRPYDAETGMNKAQWLPQRCVRRCLWPAPHRFVFVFRQKAFFRHALLAGTCLWVCSRGACSRNPWCMISFVAAPYWKAKSKSKIPLQSSPRQRSSSTCARSPSRLKMRARVARVPASSATNQLACFLR
jgi:hypothetical protein